VKVTSTESAVCAVTDATSPFGISVIAISRWPVTGSRQSGHGQLCLSQTAGKPSVTASGP
jgi:hypothetical protein